MFRSGESCDRTIQTKETLKNYDEGWERIFGKKEKLVRELHQVNQKRHTIIDSNQAKRIRKNSSQSELESLKRRREKIIREINKLNKTNNG